MSTQPATSAVPATPQRTASRGPRRRAGVLRWLGLSALLLAGTTTLLAFNGAAPGTREALHPGHASPEGAKALTQVLQTHGVDVQIAEGRNAALDLLRTEAATLVLTSLPVASDAAVAAVRQLSNEAQHTVLLTPDAKLLREFELGEDAPPTKLTSVQEPGTEACPADRFAPVAEITTDTFFLPAARAHGCFTNSDGASALLLAATANGGSITLTDGTKLFDNAHLAENGNAALAFALLGQTTHLVWYVPSAADLAADRTGTIAALTPTWVTPVMLLLLLTAVLAAVWRGRRFGPLVEETLPVTVRASETMLGRARLTARAADTHHAAEALQAGAVRRLALKLGMPRSTSPEQLAFAFPTEPELWPLLTGKLPTDDAELVRFARALSTILDRIDPLPTHPGRPPADPQICSNDTDERSTP